MKALLNGTELECKELGCSWETGVETSTPAVYLIEALHVHVESFNDIKQFSRMSTTTTDTNAKAYM